MLLMRLKLSSIRLQNHSSLLHAYATWCFYFCVTINYFSRQINICFWRCGPICMDGLYNFFRVL
ncbi:hypothetical protein RDI58_010499 [Solanum bulbocastanum]|uniref:Uncharacterized protein n=1 Tax=Solanum bulbocastanum TaxID=147425 RepID=A0AAN8TN12_SOLBU